MIGILQEWLFNQIGVNYDLSRLEEHNIFCDGIIIASILQTYGLLNESFVQRLIPTYEQEQCERNLLLLRPLLEMLQVNYDSTVVRGVVNNMASVILTLLYELFVCLESKHHLYYVSNQKFNKVQANLINNLNIKCLNVKTGKPENSTNVNDSCFEESIVKKKDIIKWYKQKYEIIKKSLDEKLQNVQQKLCSEEKTHLSPSKKKCCYSYSDVSITSLQLPEIDTCLKNNSDRGMVDYDDFIRDFKSKQYHNARVRSIDNSIRNNLINKTWNEIMEKQNEVYRAIFAEIMLKQSHYEKQIVTKLVQTQNQINIENENQMHGTKKVMDESKIEINCDNELKKDFENLENAYKNEQTRVLELHRKRYKEKQEIIKGKRKTECISIVDAIIDLAINCSKYKTEYNISVPNNVWRDWMQFFFKAQQIYTPFQKLNTDVLLGSEINYDEVIEFESIQSRVLTENDLNEYLYTCGRWFYEDICINHEYIDEEILAIIVYRILSLKYPPPPNPQPADIPSFGIAAVLLNFHGADCIEKLRMLLTKPGVHVFDTDSVIKVCMDTFNAEMKSYNDEPKEGRRKQLKSKKNLSQDPKTNAKQKKNKDSSKSEKKKSKYTVSKSIVNTDDDKIINVVDKETQTSIVKDEDIMLQKSPLAIIGEKINTILKNGDELDSSTLVSAIIEYLKQLVDSNGWVLLNYPFTLEQAAELELALTGKCIPVNELSNDNVEVPLDDLSEKRKSKLLPSPPVGPEDYFKTYFSVFVKVKEKYADASRANANDIGELQEKDESDGNFSSSVLSKGPDKSVDKLEQFYSNQNIFSELSFDKFDLFTLKQLARKILNKEELSTTSSIELFGEDIINKTFKSKKRIKSKSSVRQKGNMLRNSKKKRKESKTDDPSKSNSAIEIKNEYSREITDAEPGNQDSSVVIHPYDENRQNISLPIDREVASMLATVWENIESNYIQNLNDIFNENRILHTGLVPYTAYVRDNVHRAINNADLKQNLVNVFMFEYNHIDNNLRILTEMKSYFHCKLLEMQNNLWKISDERRNCSESRRQEIVHENWLLFEICMLINNFLSLTEAEFERSVETMKLISDYYLIMLNRDIPTKGNLSPYNLTRITADNLLLQLADLKNDGLSSSTDLGTTKEENLISRILIDCESDDRCLDYVSSFLRKESEGILRAMREKAHYFYNIIKTEKDNFYSKNKKILKSKESAEPNTSIKNTGTHSKSKSATYEQSIEPNSFNDAIDSLIREWSLAIDVELKRFNFRMELIKKRSQEDIMEYFCFIEDVFCELHGFILDQYDKEISSINKLCEFIQTAIEEETPINQPIILDQDRFFINTNIPSVEDHVEDTVIDLIEESDGCKFTIKQLSKLKNIFMIAGPCGVIRKQPFCYIIQDLMLFNAADNEPHLPTVWSSLSEAELRILIDSIFGSEYSVDWRDFIIYNLEIPFPSVDQILALRKKYLAYDSENTELITLEHFENTPLWFEEELPCSPQIALRLVLIKRLLFEIFQVDDACVNYTALLLYFCKDLDPVNGLKKALVLSIGKNVITSEDELRSILQEEAELVELVKKILNNLVDSVVNNREGVLMYEIFPYDLNNYLIEPSVVESKRSVNPSGSIPKPFSVDTECNSASLLSNRGSNHFTLTYKAKSSTEHLDKKWVSSIPIDAVVSVLNACFHHQDKTFTIRNLYLTCLEEEADRDGRIEGYELVNLSCILKIFSITNKFKISSPCNLLKENYLSRTNTT